MGPDGQQMDYSGSRSNPMNSQGPDYGQTGYGTAPRPHPYANNPQDHMPYEAGLMQDPYGRGTLPPEAEGQSLPPSPLRNGVIRVGDNQ